jgi:Zn-dependent metalloprotease
MAKTPSPAAPLTDTAPALPAPCATQAIMTPIFTMWKQWFGLDVTKEFRAAGIPTPLLVIPHGKPKEDNAAWSDFFFYCADGNQLFYPLCTGGDVLAHELAHGITQHVNGEPWFRVE